MGEYARGPDGKLYPKDPIGDQSRGAEGDAKRKQAGAPDGYVPGQPYVDPKTGNSTSGDLGYNPNETGNQQWDYFRNTRNMSPEDLEHYNAVDASSGTARQAVYGGQTDGNGAKSYADMYRGRMADNDAQQAAAAQGAEWAKGQFQGSRSNQAKEDPRIAANIAASRANQEQALGLMGTAAAGGAPSAAQGQTDLGMQSLMEQRAGAGSRNLAGLGGSQAGSAVSGQAAGVAAAGAQGRSGEVIDAMGQYGGLAGTVRSQDISGIGRSNNMSMFNSQLNNQYKLDMGQVGLNYGNLQGMQDATDRGWYQRAMHGYDAQADFDQERQEWKAQQEAAAVGGAIAKSAATRKSNEDLAYGAGQAGVTAIGSVVGGPVGGAAAGAGYSASVRKP